ncbi:NADH-quinone oxidoreductase chain J [Ehrlichia ruminantium]|uniref:NADH-quinone oxidoreductase chain J n=1 Tax=Ehrlichia ruminantium TaxID=779 RepID=A0A170SXQ5_EHRRU|nr:hypothetical protein [Ehrlichia ruminantium]GAT78454.1 NADH-quinone oxidoreductase chain J [Ehrlichia ruminantium]
MRDKGNNIRRQSPDVQISRSPFVKYVDVKVRGGISYEDSD